MKYPLEHLGPDQDDGTMVDNVDDLGKAVIGHRIVSVSQSSSYAVPTVITLDNGDRVNLYDNGDCCAYTELEQFLLHPDMVDHIITGVGTTDQYQTWHIYADLGDILELTVGWSCGNPFYYGYGFRINVTKAKEVS